MTYGGAVPVPSRDRIAELQKAFEANRQKCGLLYHEIWRLLQQGQTLAAIAREANVTDGRMTVIVDKYFPWLATPVDDTPFRRSMIKFTHDASFLREPAMRDVVTYAKLADYEVLVPRACGQYAPYAQHLRHVLQINGRLCVVYATGSPHRSRVHEKRPHARCMMSRCVLSSVEFVIACTRCKAFPHREFVVPAAEIKRVYFPPHTADHRSEVYFPLEDGEGWHSGSGMDFSPHNGAWGLLAGEALSASAD